MDGCNGQTPGEPLYREASEAGNEICRFAGVPPSTAIGLIICFSIALWFYSVLWPGAPVFLPDSPGYIRIARDLSDFRVDELSARPPGYPLLLILTGQGRALFHTSLALHFASIWLLLSILYVLGLSKSWLLLPAVILLFPPYVEYSAYVLL